MKCQSNVKEANHQLHLTDILFMVLTRDKFIEAGFFGAGVAFREPAEVCS